MVQASEPFENRTPFEKPAKVDHSKTGHVRFSDPHCIYKSRDFSINNLWRSKLFSTVQIISMGYLAKPKKKSRFQMAFKNQTIRNPEDLTPFEYRPCRYSDSHCVFFERGYLCSER